jgi:Xaa-Pro aminopeptidase
VIEAQKLALKLIKPGVDGRDIHAAVQSFFAKAGFKTGTDDKGRPYGFFHGTGHGVGLELHDPGPRTISTVPCILKPGMVTSVEPGLYYPTKGGCRIEDVVVVTPTGYKNLNKLSKSAWVIDG